MRTQRNASTSRWAKRLLAALTLGVILGPAWAAAAKDGIPMCHRPPDDPNNYTTIVVGDAAAVAAHLAHGDVVGTCESACPAALCNDHDACTTDGGTWYAVTQRCACTYTSVACDDNNPCTDDACAPATGCVNTPVSGRPCNGGNLCTTGDRCDAAGACVIGPPLNCDDGNACTDDACDPAIGCVNTPGSGRACDDGNACTTGDSCEAGVCVGGPPLNCDDDNVCTDDVCNPASGCVHSNDDVKPCDDGIACTSQDHCSAGRCVGSPYTCDRPDQCHQSTGTCNGDGTCSYESAPNGTVCDDGDVCTGCPAGGCRVTYDIDAGLLDNQSAFCDGRGENRYNCYGSYGFHWNDLGAGNVLRIDIQFQSGIACDAGASHSIALNGTAVATLVALGHCTCSPTSTFTQTFENVDVNAYIVGGVNSLSINDVYACEGLSSNGPFGSATFGQVTVTYDVEPDQCVDGSCVGGPPAPNATACDDGSACTTNNHCSAGACVGTAVSCDDNNPCTDDGCDPVAGCTHTNNTSTCNGTGICQDGQCVQGDVSACQEGQDPETGSPWVVCTADSTGAWISANDSGYYHAEQICRLLGYSGVGLWGGTCGNVCGFCEPAQTSCQNLGTEFFSAGSAPPNNCGTDQYGGILCTAVQWQCVP